MFRLNRIKKYLILLLLFVSFGFCSNAEALVKPTNDFYVNDYANILSSETEEYIIKKSKELANIDGTQIVVVTVPSLDGESLETYATELFREFGIGDKEKNNGLLLLLALEERQFRVEVGYGLEGILPDGKTGRFQDEYIIPYLKENNWDKGIRNGYDAFFAEIVKQNNLDLSYNEANSVGYSGEDVSDMIIPGFITGFIIGLILNALLKNKKKFTKYLIVLYIILIIMLMMLLSNTKWFTFSVLNLFGFMFGCAGIRGGHSRGGWSSSGGSWSSGGGFSGGGSSGGGGSSRSF